MSWGTAHETTANEEGACETNSSYETQESVNRYLLRYWGQVSLLER